MTVSSFTNYSTSTSFADAENLPAGYILSEKAIENYKRSYKSTALTEKNVIDIFERSFRKILANSQSNPLNQINKMKTEYVRKIRKAIIKKIKALPAESQPSYLYSLNEILKIAYPTAEAIKNISESRCIASYFTIILKMVADTIKKDPTLPKLAEPKRAILLDISGWLGEIGIEHAAQLKDITKATHSSTDQAAKEMFIELSNIIVIIRRIYSLKRDVWYGDYRPIEISPIINGINDIIKKKAPQLSCETLYEAINKLLPEFKKQLQEAGIEYHDQQKRSSCSIL